MNSEIITSSGIILCCGKDRRHEINLCLVISRSYRNLTLNSKKVNRLYASYCYYNLKHTSDSLQTTLLSNFSPYLFLLCLLHFQLPALYPLTPIFHCFHYSSSTSSFLISATMVFFVLYFPHYFTMYHFRVKQIHWK